MLVELSGNHLVGRLHDEFALLVVEFSEVTIDQCGGLLELRHRNDDLLGHTVPRPRAFTDVEMNERARGLRAVIFVGGNVDLAHRVGLDARFDRSVGGGFCSRHGLSIFALSGEFRPGLRSGKEDLFSGITALMRWRLVSLSLLSLLVTLFVTAPLFGVGGRPWFGWWDSNTLRAAPYTVRIVEPRPGGATERAGLRAGDLIDLREQSLGARIAVVSQLSATRPTIVTVERGGNRSTHSVIGSTSWEGATQWKLPPQVLTSLAALWFGICALLLSLRQWSRPDARLLIFTLLCFSTVLLDPRYFVPPSATVQLVLFIVTRACLAIAPLLLLQLSSRSGRPSRLRTALTLAAIAFVGIGFLADVAAAIGIATLWFDPLPFIYRV